MKMSYDFDQCFVKQSLVDMNETSGCILPYLGLPDSSLEYQICKGNRIAEKIAWESNNVVSNQMIMAEAFRI